MYASARRIFSHTGRIALPLLGATGVYIASTSLLRGYQTSAKVDTTGPVYIARSSLVRKKLFSEFTSDYEILHKLGEGGFARIYKVRHRPTNAIRVAKVANIESESDMAIFMNEVDVMTQLDSPYVGRIIEYYVRNDENGGFIPRTSSRTAVLISHYIDGIDLLDTINERMKNRKQFLDDELRDIARQILKSLAYVHRMGYVHRDIKPENYVCTSSIGGKILLKLIDHGLATRADSRRNYVERAGTSFYMAPETFGDRTRKREYSEKSDCWSVGVILATAASGGNALIGRSTSLGSAGGKPGEAELRLIQTQVNKLVDRDVSHDLIDLIQKLLHPDPKQRISAEEALKHPFCERAHIKAGLSHGQIELLDRKLSISPNITLLAKVVRLMMAHHVNDSDVPDAQFVFRHVDAESEGYVSFDKLRKAVDYAHYNLEEDFKRWDISSGRGQLSFEGFLSACLTDGVLSNVELLRFVFQELSAGGQRITPTHLSSYFASSGITKDSAQTLLNSCFQGGASSFRTGLDFHDFRKCVSGSN